MRRFALAAALALLFATQADAQIFRRRAVEVYYPSGAVVVNNGYTTSGYVAPTGVVTAGYYNTPVVGSYYNGYYPPNYNYAGYGYGYTNNYYTYPRYGYGRRWGW